MGEVLYRLAIEYAGLTGDETVYDLYCGTGTIGLAMAKDALTVWGVEISEESVACALENMDLNGITNAAFFAGNVAQSLEELRRAGGRARTSSSSTRRAPGLAGKALRRLGAARGAADRLRLVQPDDARRRPEAARGRTGATSSCARARSTCSRTRRTSSASRCSSAVPLRRRSRARPGSASAGSVRASPLAARRPDHAAGGGVDRVQDRQLGPARGRRRPRPRAGALASGIPPRSSSDARPARRRARGTSTRDAPRRSARRGPRAARPRGSSPERVA